jgi:FkbM family methyltransferase
MLLSFERLISGERYRLMESELAEARQAVTRWKATAAEARDAVAAEARLALSPHVLRALFPARLEAVRTRSGLPVPRQRHAAFLNECGAYREAVAQVDVDDPTMFAVTMAGIRWWVPAGEQQPDREARVRAQDLPWRAIVQTREVSVGPVMIDVGANIGRTTIPRLVLGDIGVAYTAEPDPTNYRAFVRTLVTNSLTGLVYPDHCGIGDIDGEIALRRSKYIGGHAVRPGGDSALTIRVPCRRLDSWLSSRHVDLEAVSFIKVDVQGWETRVLQGAPGALAKRHIAWQIEVEPQQLAAAGSSLSELLAIVEGHFAQFVDLHPEATGARMRPIADLASSLGYLADGRGKKTDLVLIG